MRQEMQFDELLSDHLGDFGRYQVLPYKHRCLKRRLEDVKDGILIACIKS